MAASMVGFRLVQTRLQTISCHTFIQELRFSPFGSHSSYLSQTRPCSSISQKTSTNRLQCSKLGSSNCRLPNSTAAAVSLFSRSRPGYCHAFATPVLTRNFASQPPEIKQVKTAKLIAVRNPFNIIRDLLYSWLIKVYFDPDFSLYEFADGAKQAIVIISHELSQGAFDNLKGLVQNDVIISVKEHYKKLSEQDRMALARNSVDLTAYPHDIRVHYDTEGATKIIKVKIQMKCIAPNTDAVTDNSVIQITNPLYCDYEFYRDFSPGMDPQWTVSDISYPIFHSKEKQK